MNRTSLNALRQSGLVAGGLAVLVGGCGLAGWIFGSDALKSVFHGGIMIKANASIGLLCGGAAWLSHYRPGPVPRGWRALGVVLGGIAAAIGGLTLLEHLTRADFGIDQLLFREPPGARATASPGRMGPPASVCLMLSGVGAILLGGRRPRVIVAQAFGVATCAVAAIPVMGYAFGMDRLYGVPHLTGISLHAALGVLALGLTAILARPERGIGRLISADDVGGLMARRLLLPGLLLPFVSAFVLSWGEQQGWLDLPVSRTLGVLFLSGCSGFLILFNARSMSKLEGRRTAAEQDRERQHKRTNEIIETLQDGFYALGPDLRVVQVNHQAERAWGRNREALLGEPIARLLPRVAQAADLAAHETVLRERVPRHYETRADPLGAWFEVSLYPDIEGGVVAFFRDVTARRAAEAELRRAKAEAERASQAKSEFLATLSHEMRTPLSPVMLAVPMIEALPGLPEEARGYLESIRRNVELEVRLISDLLDLTRVEKGKLQLELAEVDLHEILRAVASICRRDGTAPIELALDAGRHWMRGDSARLHQVFWNLLTNAQKFTEATGRIVVRTEASRDGGIAVSVSDTGQGIAAELIPRLFTAFEQGNARDARQRGGLGLGLAISRNIVELHQGSIQVVSAGPGLGSTFTVSLPVFAANRVPAVRGAADLATVERPFKILLVEDHGPTLAILTQALRRMGHDVVPAGSCAEARAAAAAGAGCDFLISDLGLTDGTGFDLMRGLREHFAGRSIALSGYGTEEDVAAAHDAGFAVHLIKPVQLPALRAAIARCSGAGAAPPRADGPGDAGG